MEKKLLIIEDDANILYSLQAKFRVEGFEVIIDSGMDMKEIMDKINKTKPNYVILDLILPRVDGFEILKNIKSNPEISHMQTFIFTSLSDEDSRAKGMKYGVDHYIIKSDFSVDDFVAKVQKIIANQQSIK